MSVKQEMEVVSVDRIHKDSVRVGLAITGTINNAPVDGSAPGIGVGAGPGMRVPLPVHASVEWPAADQPATGEVITVTYTRSTTTAPTKAK